LACAVEKAARQLNRGESGAAFSEDVKAGGLISYGANAADLIHRAAGYVDKTKAQSLPIFQSSSRRNSSW
jgi:hypothetical protein